MIRPKRIGEENVENEKSPYFRDFFVVAGEIFIRHADEVFPFLFGRKGTFDEKGAYLSLI